MTRHARARRRDFEQRGPAEELSNQLGWCVAVNPFLDDPPEHTYVEPAVQPEDENLMGVRSLPRGASLDAYWLVRGDVFFVMCEQVEDLHEEGFWAWHDRRHARYLKLRARVRSGISREVFRTILQRFLELGVLGRTRRRCEIGVRPVKVG